MKPIGHDIPLTDDLDGHQPSHRHHRFWVQRLINNSSGWTTRVWLVASYDKGRREVVATVIAHSRHTMSGASCGGDVRYSGLDLSECVRHLAEEQERLREVDYLVMHEGFKLPVQGQPLPTAELLEQAHLDFTGLSLTDRLNATLDERAAKAAAASRDQMNAAAAALGRTPLSLALDDD